MRKAVIPEGSARGSKSKTSETSFSTIRSYHDEAGEHHRYRSWEHCYRYYQSAGPRGVSADPDQAALHLAFYLASWGMYRGSSFLLQHAYTVHLGVVELLSSSRFDSLWGIDFGSEADDRDLIPLLIEFVDGIRVTYQPFAPTPRSSQPTDTLISKVILGTLGWAPACDRYFIAGFKNSGYRYSRLNDLFLEGVLSFVEDHLRELRREQVRILRKSGAYYPLVKLVDMHFWQMGYDDDMGSGD